MRTVCEPAVSFVPGENRALSASTLLRRAAVPLPESPYHLMMYRPSCTISPFDAGAEKTVLVAGTKSSSAYGMSATGIKVAFSVAKRAGKRARIVRAEAAPSATNAGCVTVATSFVIVTT